MLEIIMAIKSEIPIHPETAKANPKVLPLQLRYTTQQAQKDSAPSSKPLIKPTFVSLVTRWDFLTECQIFVHKHTNSYRKDWVPALPAISKISD